MEAVFKGVFGYCFLVLMVRIAGRRPGRQMAPFEYILIFFIGGLTLTPLVGNDRSLVNATATILTIAFTHFFLTWLRRKSATVGRILDGTPIVLLEKGQWHPESMAGMLIRDDDVMAAARDKGIRSLEEIEYAVLERNGEISIVRRRSA